MTDIVDIRKHSVTAGDEFDYRNGGGVYFFNIWNGGYRDSFAGLAPTPPRYWSFERDFALKATMFHEAMWVSAINKAITKIAAQGWQVEDTDDSSRRTDRAQRLMHTADGKGWVHFISRHLQDFLLTDNGAFVEVVRASNARGSRILGLMHLDSSRCTRTGDPDVPVIYRDLKGVLHELKDYQVLPFADMPNPSESWFGVGFCAASRAYRTIYKLASIEQYVTEKVSGNGALAINIVKGVSPRDLDTALNTADQEQARKGKYLHKGAIVVPVLGDMSIELITIPLAEIPDGFDAKQERDNAYIIYANAIGVAVQDIQPLGHQGLGTGTQSVILDEAAEGQGLAAWRKMFEHTINEYILPETTTFSFVTNDIRDQKAQAEVEKMRAETRNIQVEGGVITTAMALQMASDIGDVPKEFLPNDVTPAGQLFDNEKPVTETAGQADAQSMMQQMQQVLQPAPPPQMKEKKVDIDEEIIAAAERLYAEVAR